MAKPLRPFRSVPALDRAIATLAERVRKLTAPSSAARPKGWQRELEAALSSVSTLSEAIAHVRGAADDFDGDGVGFRVGASDVDGDYSEDHGQDVDYDHDADLPATKTRHGHARPHIGFRLGASR